MAEPRNNGAVSGTNSLTESWTLGALRVSNRVLLAPLAGIGNWFVRLQAKRYGAGMAFSEMVSSHAIHHRNRKTCIEMLRIDPREREGGRGGGRRGEGWSERGRGEGGWSEGGRCEGGWSEGEWSEEGWSEGGSPGGGWSGGPVSIQLFGEDPAIMRSAAAYIAAQTDADAIDINMGCPVPKVLRTGAGAGMLADHDLAVAVTRAVHEGAAEGAALAGHSRARECSAIPITVKLRSGLRPGEESGCELARRLVEEGGAAAIAFHPRPAAVHHKGRPDYELAARLVAELDAPVILTGGLHDAPSTVEAFERTGAAAVMLARGSLGNPWLFEQLLGRRQPGREPAREEVLDELDWTIERAVEHFGEDRATRYLRKFYPWYTARLGLHPVRCKRLGESLQTAATLEEVHALLALRRRLDREPDPEPDRNLETSPA